MYLIELLSLLLALAAAFISARYPRLILGFGLGVVTLGGAGMGLPSVLPAYAALVDPWVSFFCGYFCLWLGGGILVGLGAGCVYRLLARLLVRPPHA